ncbi:hypothetical protein HDU98_006120, partial [Podochytrium sp. JEL0797]
MQGIPASLHHRVETFTRTDFLPTLRQAFPRTDKPPSAAQQTHLLSQVMRAGLVKPFVEASKELRSKHGVAACLSPRDAQSAQVVIQAAHWMNGPDLSAIKSSEQHKWTVIQLNESDSVVVPNDQVQEIHDMSESETDELIESQMRRYGSILHMVVTLTSEIEYELKERNERTGWGDVIMWDKREKFELKISSSHSSRWEWGTTLPTSFVVADIDDLMTSRE